MLLSGKVTFFTALQSTFYQSRALNRHVDLENSACFKALPFFETTCFQSFCVQLQRNFCDRSQFRVSCIFSGLFILLSGELRTTGIPRTILLQCANSARLLFLPGVFVLLSRPNLPVLGESFFVLLVLKFRICFLIPRIFFT